MFVQRFVHWPLACLPTGVVLVFQCPVLRLYNLLLLLKAAVLLSEVPVCVCLSHGAQVCRSAVCLLDELLPSGNHCSDVLEGMIAQVLLLAQEARLE